MEKKNYYLKGIAILLIQHLRIFNQILHIVPIYGRHICHIYNCRYIRKHSWRINNNATYLPIIIHEHIQK